MMASLSRATTEGQVQQFISAITLFAQTNSNTLRHNEEAMRQLTAAVAALISGQQDTQAHVTSIRTTLSSMEQAAKLNQIPNLEARKRSLALRVAKQQYLLQASMAPNYNEEESELAWETIAQHPKLADKRVEEVLASGSITTEMLLAPDDVDASGDALMDNEHKVREQKPLPYNASRSSSLRFVLPQPPKFRGDLDKQVTSAKVWIEHLVAYLAEHNMDFCNYMPFFLEGKALEWGRGQVNMLRAENRLTAEQLQQDFLMRYDDLLFTPAKKARDKLFDRSYAQTKGEPFAAYQQRFREIIRDAAGMSHADKIEFFVRGLQPDLEQRCTTDRGRVWADLEEVIRHANGEDIAMRVSSSRSVTNKSAVSLNAVHARPSNPRNDNSNNKRKQVNGAAAGGTGSGGSNPAKRPRQPNVCGKCSQTFSGSWNEHKPHCPKIGKGEGSSKGR